MSESDSLLARLSKMKDEAVADFTQELLTNPRFAKALGAAVQRVSKSKKKLDRNVSMLMSLSGLPSKADYDRLAESALSLGKGMARLEERIDELVLRVEKLSAKTKKGRS